jgi:hypothetical protein
LHISEISDENFIFCLSISEILFVISRAFNYDLFELKLDFLSELESFVKNVSKFGVVSVTKRHCSTSLVKEAELQAQIPEEIKLGVTPKLTRKANVDFQPKVKGRVCIEPI